MNILRAFAVILALSANLQAEALDPARGSRQRNYLFEPLFAYDDIDAHTVSAGSQEVTKPKPVAPAVRANELGLVSSRTSSVAAKPTTTTTSTRSASSSGGTATLTSAPAPSITSVSPKRVQSSIPIRQVISESRVAKRTEASQPAQHWSGLQNYYQKILDQQQQLLQAGAKPTQQLKLVHQLQAVQQPQVLSGGYPTGMAQQVLDFIDKNADDSLKSAFLAPYSKQLIPTYSGGTQQPYAFELGQQAVPAVSRPAGIQWKTNEYPIQSYYDPGQKSMSTGGISYIGSTGINDNVQKSLTDASIDQSRRLEYDKFYQPYPSSQSPLTLSTGSDRKLNYNSGLRMLPEWLTLDWSNNRLKHQQETFGSIYNPQQLYEQNRDELFCYRQMQILSHYKKAPSGSLVIAAETSPKQSRFKYDTQARSSSQLENQQDPPSLGPNEYPAHVGIYNGSEKNIENFLCSATWIHENFALTVASCLRSIPDPKVLVVRLGEWNLDKNSTKGSERYTVVRQVKQVYPFYRFRNDTLEHNLALVEFDMSLGVSDVPLLSPACQVQPRSLMRSDSCWTPTRNILSSEYFDPDGDGETKERKQVDMKETAIKLYANNDAECTKQTGIESFNYRYPNYICSDNYRSTKWRSSINQAANFGSGIYCNENGQINLVSIVHPVNSNSSSALGYMDLTYYKPWIRTVIYGRNY